MSTPNKLFFFFVATAVVSLVTQLRITTSYFNLLLPQVNSVVDANMRTSTISGASEDNGINKTAQVAEVQALHKTLDEDQSPRRIISNEDVRESKKPQVQDAPKRDHDVDKSGVVSKKEGSTITQADKSTLKTRRKSRTMTALNISDHRRGNETFSACLIWNDDLARLPEWIAYHYQVLPLGHLVFFRDPKSTLDPLPVLNRFKDLMKITYWTNVSDITDGFPGAEEELAEREALGGSYFKYLRMQTMVYRQCYHHLKRMGETWVYVADTDEFAVLNNAAVPDAYSKMKQHGIILETIRTAQENQTLLKTWTQKRRWFGERSNCIVLTRYRYSSYETKRELVTQDVPSNFDPYRFVTLRFFHYVFQQPGKSIGDLSKFNLPRVATDFHAHRLLPDGCGGFEGARDDLVHVNHYAGSWEYFYRPGDPSRSREAYDEMARNLLDKTKSKNGGTARLWLQGLVDYLGEDKALFLLHDTGFAYNASSALPILELKQPF